MNPSLRKPLLATHRWTGLTVGVIAAFLALTGLTMAFRVQLEPRADHELLDRPACETRQPLDVLVSRASTVHPGSKLQRVEIADLRTAATAVRFADGNAVYLDPCSGEALAQRSAWGGFFGFMEQVHKLRFLGNKDLSEVIGGSVSLVVAIVMVGGGLLLLWPGSVRALKAMLRPRWDLRGRTFDISLHRTVALYMFAVLLVQTLSSLTLTFDWAKKAVIAAAGSAAPAAAPKAAAPGPMLPLETFLDRSRALMPGMRLAVLTPPKKPGDAFEVLAIERDAAHGNARSYAWFDPATGALLRFDPFAASSAGNMLYRWLGAVHQGKAGLALQLLLFAGILGVPVLAFTGIRSYVRRRIAASTQSTQSARASAT